MMRRAGRVGCCLLLAGVLLASACSVSTTVADVSDSSASSTASETTADAVESAADSTTTIVPGTGLWNGGNVHEQFSAQGESIRVETVDHVATVERSSGDFFLFHYRSGDSFCHHAKGSNSATESTSAANGCSSNDQMAAGRPFLRRTTTLGSGDLHVWVSNAAAATSAATFIVETDSGSRFTSAVVNNLGYVVVDDGSTPVEALLVDANGTTLWSDEVRT